MIRKIFISLALLVITVNAQAQWQLVNKQSQLNFVSVKKNKIGEVHHFKNLKGTIDDQGNARISVDLNSVESKINIRNERMQSMLFETLKFPAATVKAKLDSKKLKSLKPGNSFISNITFKTTLHGINANISSDVRITRLNNNVLLATSLQPMIISAEQYKLAEGIEKLRKVAKLPSISSAVPVTFSFIFQQK